MLTYFLSIKTHSMLKINFKNSVLSLSLLTDKRNKRKRCSTYLRKVWRLLIGKNAKIKTKVFSQFSGSHQLLKGIMLAERSSFSFIFRLIGTLQHFSLLFIHFFCYFTFAGFPYIIDKGLTKKVLEHNKFTFQSVRLPHLRLGSI